MRSAPPAALAIALLCLTSRIAAQSSYYNLDGSRPLRVEDALPTERHALDVEFAPFRVERYSDGSIRWRAEPKLSYGVLPLTEIEVRMPVVAVERAWLLRPKVGAAGIAVGALHAFGVETGSLPAIALGGEVLLPAGPLAGPRASWTAKGLLTRTGSHGRLQLNAAYGSYSVRTTPPSSVAGVCNPSIPNCITVVAPPFDFPCAPPNVPRMAMTACSPRQSATTNAAGAAPRARFDPTRSSGAHWVAGVGADHAFGLRSTLVSADVVAERFVGLYSIDDWTGEVGLRHQLSQRMVLDAGIGRHFAGVVQSTTATLGLTWELALRP